MAKDMEGRSVISIWSFQDGNKENERVIYIGANCDIGAIYGKLQSVQTKTKDIIGNFV